MGLRRRSCGQLSSIVLNIFDFCSLEQIFSMKRYLWFISLALIYLNSCVPNKKYIYLQKDDVNKKDLPKDTMVRMHDLKIKDYEIQPLDILSIRIESLTDEEFNFMSRLYPSQQAGANQANLLISGFLVDNNGDIEFPVLGKVKFVGLSVFEAQDKLQKLLIQYLKNPIARIRLLNFRFTLLGEVNAENQVISNNTRVTIMEAVGLGGGLTDLADRSNVKIIRQSGDKSKVLYLNLLDENLIASENYYVQQNDIIIVPALRQRPFRKYWGQNLALLISTVSVILLTINLISN
jgi:polysaccharide export outer membrane protein